MPHNTEHSPLMASAQHDSQVFIEH